jgi:UDP-N-acetyl-D-glucosamine dehydrogenase
MRLDRSQSVTCRSICIPIDPLYLTWKAREFEGATRFVELAGQINIVVPEPVVNKLAETLDGHPSRGLNGAQIAIIRLAYKKNIEDTRDVSTQGTVVKEG